MIFFLISSCNKKEKKCSSFTVESRQSNGANYAFYCQWADPFILLTTTTIYPLGFYHLLKPSGCFSKKTPFRQSHMFNQVHLSFSLDNYKKNNISFSIFVIIFVSVQIFLYCYVIDVFNPFRLFSTWLLRMKKLVNEQRPIILSI